MRDGRRRIKARGKRQEARGMRHEARGKRQEAREDVGRNRKGKVQRGERQTTSIAHRTAIQRENRRCYLPEALLRHVIDDAVLNLDLHSLNDFGFRGVDDKVKKHMYDPKLSGYDNAVASYLGF
jgi:hypothetical protein